MTIPDVIRARLWASLVVETIASESSGRGDYGV